MFNTTLRYTVVSPKVRWLERGRLATGIVGAIFVWLLTSPIDRVHTAHW